MDPTDKETAPDLEVTGSSRENEKEEDSTVVVVEEKILGLESPKRVQWDELQQELARLWSLSTALRKGKERKEALAPKLEKIVEVRRESLQQSNELEEMRQGLKAKELALGEMVIREKKMREDVKFEREQLSAAIRLLLVAGKTLSTAQQHLQEANRLLHGKRGLGHLRTLEKMLRARQQYMVAQVATLYPVKLLGEQSSGEKIHSHSHTKKSGNSEGSSLQKSSLTILGLQLTVLPVKKLSFFGDKKEVQRSASVLGYVAHAVLLIASFMDVPLRYPLRLGGSHSYIYDYAPSVEPTNDLASAPVSPVGTKPMEFPLFLDVQDTTRAAYAVFLLNKDLEQLLNYIGAESLGPRHILANLRLLMRIIQSPEYLDR